MGSRRDGGGLAWVTDRPMYETKGYCKDRICIEDAEGSQRPLPLLLRLFIPALRRPNKDAQSLAHSLQVLGR